MISPRDRSPRSGLWHSTLQKKEVKLPCVTQNELLTVASFRTSRGWAMLCCAGLDPKLTNTFSNSLFHWRYRFSGFPESVNQSKCNTVRDRLDDFFIANHASAISSADFIQSRYQITKKLINYNTAFLRRHIFYHHFMPRGIALCLAIRSIR